jgi:hypothetical protein
LGPIDVVYTWVNGSDPVLAKELQDFEARQQGHSAAIIIIIIIMLQGPLQTQ